MELARNSVYRECLSVLRTPRTWAISISATSRLDIQNGRTYVTHRRPRNTGRIHARSDLPGQRTKARWISAASGEKADAGLGTGQDLSTIHARILELADTILKPSDDMLVPSEQRVLYVLEQLEALAKTLLDEQTYPIPKQAPERPKAATATSALLGSVNTQRRATHATRTSLLALISERAEALARHPNVFLTSAILKSYVALQIQLAQPASFPDVFDLYARKPVPSAAHGRVEHTSSNPDKVNTAVDSNTANAALALAMEVRNLSLCMDIINTTFCTPSYKKAKVLRQALVPGAGLTLAPLAAYTVANQFASFQNTMDPSYASGVAFAGIMTYVGAVSMVGYVAVTTANDQMDRVTWAQGVPLWERWIREEERSALDRVAGRWGFQNREKRGDEEGLEWESLREFIGMRGMVLDKVELMEGME